MNCSLQFYFRYLSGIKVDQTKDDDIGADVMGTVAHGVLEDFYKPLEKKQLRVEDLHQMKPKIADAVRAGFLQVGIDARDLESGNNLLTFKGVEKMLGNFINAEIRLIERLADDGQVVIIEQIERDLERRMMVEVNGENKTVSFRGRTDRIDRIGETIRVVDYKTGGVMPKDLKLTEQSDIIGNAKTAKALQLMQYALMTPEEYKDMVVVPGIISLRSPSAGLMPLMIDKQAGLTSEEREETAAIFHKIASELVDPTMPFEQTDDTTRCTYCDFTSICNR